MIFLPRLLVLAKGIPIWAWALAAVLAWGAWHRYQAISERKAFQEAKNFAEKKHLESVIEAQQTTSKWIFHQKEATNAETIRRQAAERATASLNGELGKLRARLASEATGTPGDPKTPGSGSPATGRSSLLADLLGECAERLITVATEADAYRSAGRTCEASYDALTKPD